jgi:hypothetical protein
MEGKLKNKDFYIGYRTPFSTSEKGKIVTIIDSENHPIYGRRYKILGYDAWFENNCFEYVK